MSESNITTVNLFCPSLSKTVQLVARDDQLIDLGSIGRTFGLDPATLKLNGHFICRGVDLIASSVTWKSLISFFSSRGFSTGTCGYGAVVVDGKILTSGCKRAHDSAIGISRINRKPQLEELNLSKKTKLKDPEVNTESGKFFISNLLCLKRKHEVGNSSMKRCKVDESGMLDNHSRPRETILTRILIYGWIYIMFDL